MSMFKDEEKKDSKLLIFTKKIINKIRFALIVLNLLFGITLMIKGVLLSIIFIVNAIIILESYLKYRVAKDVKS